MNDDITDKYQVFKHNDTNNARDKSWNDAWNNSASDADDSTKIDNRDTITIHKHNT